MCLQRLVSVVKFIAERELAFRDDENVGSLRNFFQKNFQNFFQAKFQKKKMPLLLLTNSATVHKSLIIVKYHLHHVVL